MRIQVLSLQTVNTNFLQNTNDNKKNKNKNKNVLIAATGLCSIGFFGTLLIKSGHKIDKNVIRTKFSETDMLYLNKIIKSLKKEGIEVGLEDLKSIVTPGEFLSLVKNFKPEHFMAGLQISEQKAKSISLEEFYKNSVDGNFRVSLHTHSNCSDGKLTPDEFLECARKYADKIASMNKKDDLPPFTIALTDHDCVDGCKEIIKLIAKNPQKYKNLKFVSGCEFSVKDGDKHHDITGLAINPFDKNLLKDLTDLYVARKQTVQNFLNEQPEYDGHKITQSDLIKFEKKYYEQKGKAGKRSIENGSGVVSVRHAIKFFYKLTNRTPETNQINNLGEKDIPTIEKVINTIKTAGGYASLTHPLKSFWKYIGDEELLRLKNLGVNGIEVNHQYTPSKITKLGEINNNKDEADIIYKNLTEQYKTFAKENNMFLSGGTDSHEKQIFSRQPKITQEFLENKLLK